MAAMHAAAVFEIDSERSAEQGLLDVMHGHRVAAEQRLHVAFADQISQMLRAACVDDHGSGNDHHLATALADTTPLPGDLFDDEFDAAFARHARFHEPELFL